jgi:hypothetical protein
LSGLEISCFVKLGVVALFDNPSLQVKIDDILICSGIPKKDTREVISIKFATYIAAFLNMNPQSKNFQRGQAKRGFAKEASVYFPYLDSVLFCTVHYATLPFRHSAISQFRHSAIPPFRHSAIPPFCRSAIPPFRHSAISSFCHSAILPFYHSTIPPFRSNTQ